MAETQFVERLTSLDLLMPGGYVGALLVFPMTQQSQALLTKLQNSLDLVCERIPWLMGRVCATSATERQRSTLEIRWTATDTPPRITNKGSISHAYEELSRAQIPLENIPADLWISPSAGQIEPGSGAPVFAASLFQFADDKAVGLCIQTHHNAVDGFGFTEVLSLWARCMNEPGSQISSFSPSLNRNGRLAKALDQNSTTNSSLDELFERHPEYSRHPPVLPTKVSACTSEILTIAMKKIDGIKESLKPYLETAPSTNTIACVLLWSAITRARMRRNPDLRNKTSRLPMAVNGRKRLDADLADAQNPYLGNTVLFSLVEMAASDVSNCGQGNASSMEQLAEACGLVAKAQSSDRIDSRHIREVCSIVEGLEDYRSIFPGWELFGSRDLFITSWADLNMYEFDFGEGLGKPRFVRIPYAQADGNVIILPRNRSATEERLEVVIMLQRDDLEVLREDSLWEH
ncbi:hypothetical protein PISL3812_05089 [Talaromyces islandicus]|uniref:Uncharacterized protein n=1 Tax=Talaromyces islandicus TaxID=28573 RepID=A0A0U1LXE8_TALIS|nr:hypothetical protein PISL3812_05089 [Talaromyces islandicus]